MRKTIQMMKASSVIIVCGILLHGCFDGWDAVDYDSFWGTKQEDLVGAWKADGTNYGKRYKSDTVCVETIRTLRLELYADGAFKAENVFPGRFGVGVKMIIEYSHVVAVNYSASLWGPAFKTFFGKVYRLVENTSRVSASAVVGGQKYG